MRRRTPAVLASALTALALVAMPGAGVAAAVDEGTIVAPCVVGKGRAAAQEICSVPAGGGTAKAITKDRGQDVAPRLSPDGTRIAYLCDWSRESGNYAPPVGDVVDFGPRGFARNAGGSLCLVDIDGTDRIRLVEDVVVQTPSWSPDGRRLVFAVGAPITDGIEVVGVDGRGRRRLVDGSGVDFPQWSPDGGRIAFTSEGGGVAVLDLAGGTTTVLTDGSSGSDLAPTWSPDGGRIAFTRYPPDATRAVWVMTSSGADARRLTSEPNGPDPNVAYDFSPHWSPDGTRVLVMSNHPMARGANFGFSVVPVSGGAATEVSPAPKSPRSFGSLFPAWSPDGTRIVFLSDYVNGRTYDLYTVAAAGGDVRRVTKGTAEELEPTWSPTTP